MKTYRSTKIQKKKNKAPSALSFFHYDPQKNKFLFQRVDYIDKAPVDDLVVEMKYLKVPGTTVSMQLLQVQDFKQLNGPAEMEGIGPGWYIAHITPEIKAYQEIVDGITIEKTSQFMG